MTSAQKLASKSMQRSYHYLSVDIEDDGTAIIDAVGGVNRLPVQIVIAPNGDTDLTSRI